GDERTGELVDPRAELELLAAQRDPAHELAPPAGDLAALGLELEPVVAELDGDPPDRLRAGQEALLALDLDVPRERLRQLLGECLDEHLEVGAVRAERRGDEVEVRAAHGGSVYDADLERDDHEPECAVDESREQRHPQEVVRPEADDEPPREQLDDADG